MEMLSNQSPDAMPVESGTGGQFGFVRELAVFAELSDEAVGRLAECLVEERFSEDELIFRSGDSSEFMYFVRHGVVAVFESTVGRPTRLLARVGPGEIFGEMGLLDDRPRGASARAMQATETLKLSKDDFVELSAAHPGLSLRFTLEALTRFSENMSRLMDPQSRRRPRVHVGKVVRLEWEDGVSDSVSLENLSAGGMCLRGLDCPLETDEPFSGRLSLVYGQELLRFQGRIAWRRHHALGIAFTDQSDDIGLRVREALRKALSEDLSQAKPK